MVFSGIRGNIEGFSIIFVKQVKVIERQADRDAATTTLCILQFLRHLQVTQQHQKVQNTEI